MTWIDIVIIIAAAAVVTSAVVGAIVRKKKGETGCGCSCKNCPSACACNAVQKQTKEEENV